MMQSFMKFYQSIWAIIDNGLPRYGFPIHAFQIFYNLNEKSGRILIPNYTYQVTSYLYLCNQEGENDLFTAYYDMSYSDGFCIKLFASGKKWRCFYYHLCFILLIVKKFDKL